MTHFKLILVFVLSVSFFCTKAQLLLQGTIRDAKTNEPLAYCAVAIKHSARGCLSNEEGLFQIQAKVETDTLLISMIGYAKKQVAAGDFVKAPVIYLERKGASLSEVVVLSNNDYLYTLFEKCREKLLQSPEKISKAYYALESEIAEQPIELIECYYNGIGSNTALSKLNFKNGRVGLASYEGRQFVSSDISKAFTFLNLTTPELRLPAIPLQLKKKKLKKNYELTLKYIYDKENPTYCIAFTPKDTAGPYFSGEAWIEKTSGDLKKISLNISNTTEHPFLPLHKDLGKVETASIQITKTYASNGHENLLSHVNFNYQLNYNHYHNSMFLNRNADTSFIVKSKGLLYFYDYGVPFIEPYFSYDADQSDYRKITALSYNDYFWQNSNSLVYSETMKKKIAYFKKNGALINYKSKDKRMNNDLRKPGGFVYETNYIEWSPSKRISLKKDRIKNDTVVQGRGQSFLVDRYNLKAQIFLDLNPVNDTLQHYSITIFDVFETYYNIPEEPFTSCFLNIYFDLVEIERQKMEKAIRTHFTVAQFDSLYKQTNKNIEAQTTLYFKEVERGKNYKALKKWSEFVRENIGIDNREIFQVTEIKQATN